MTGSIAWKQFDLIVFDMDGTLYDQAALRRRMLTLLVREAVRSRSLAVPRLLGAFRRHRERLADRADVDFIRQQYRLRGHDSERVREVVNEWIDERPLPHLRSFRAKGIVDLFARLAASHIVAVHSDYPAARKLEALGLSAHFAVAADDVGRLKPDPAGLHWLMAAAKTGPSRTLMIGDRADRDGEAARRAGVRALIRGRDFRHFDDPIFGHAA
ncbi:HAD family hydrolase [Sphingobium sp.]|uniref:HAD family hydrolase n=1 Tax=Sphingobium sp. TaxID=1912891 RepID=UPI0028BDF83E|nr:HAD family hydrolase [Sphingobium sp.]